MLLFSVARRRREFGIRAAMGARPADLRRLVIGDGLRIASFTQGASPIDPLTWLAVTTLLLLVALAATRHPARRAMRA